MALDGQRPACGPAGGYPAGARWRGPHDGSKCVAYGASGVKMKSRVSKVTFFAFPELTVADPPMTPKLVLPVASAVSRSAMPQAPTTAWLVAVFQKSKRRTDGVSHTTCTTSPSDVSRSSRLVSFFSLPKSVISSPREMMNRSAPDEPVN